MDCSVLASVVPSFVGTVIGGLIAIMGNYFALKGERNNQSFSRIEDKKLHVYERAVGYATQLSQSPMCYLDDSFRNKVLMLGGMVRTYGGPECISAYKKFEDCLMSAYASYKAESDELDSQFFATVPVYDSDGVLLDYEERFVGSSYDTYEHQYLKLRVSFQPIGEETQCLLEDLVSAVRNEFPSIKDN